MDGNASEIFWSASIEELRKGIVEDDKEYKCIICEEGFEKGRIYEVNSKLYEAEKAAKLHIEEEHGSVGEYLLSLNSSFTGISEIQKSVLSLMYEGLSDKEIAQKLGVAQSTIRNHRYKFREKEKQARIFLALMESIEVASKKSMSRLDKDVLLDAHKTATTVDDRYNVTEKEKESIVKGYIDQNGALKNYPVKEKRKIIVLEYIAKNFSKGKTYSEKEVNRILKRIYEDYATLRRALIEYGFIERTKNGSSYWVKE